MDISKQQKIYVRPGGLDKRIICDPEDVEKLSKYTWTFDKDGRVRTTIDGKQYRLHQLIVPNYKLTDHVNGNHYDVRKRNLREATVAQNGWNRKKTVTNTSGYKGVYKYAEKNLKKPWFARITVNKIVYHLGSFSTPEEASIAYKVKAKELHGEFYNDN